MIKYVRFVKLLIFHIGGTTMLFFILFNALSDSEKDFVNQIFLDINVKLYNIALNILRNPTDAEEAVSQTFLKIIQHINKIDQLPCPQIEPYCVIMLKNETMNIIRQRKKTLYAEEVDYLNQIDPSSDIEEGYLKAANKGLLLECINKLPEAEKSFIYLRFANDMNYKKIAETLDITEDAAKKRGQRILKKLRQYYEEGEQGV